MNFLKAAALVVAALLVSVPAFAQFDLSGTWGSRSNQDEMERGPGPDPVDYLGLPLNDEGRAKALSYNYSMLSLPEYQCGYLTPFYIVLGPFGLRIWSELDPITGRIVAWKRGSARTAASKARSADVFSSSTLGSTTRPLQRTLSARTRAPGARRGARASR